MSLEDIPTYFSDFLDISLEAGQAILSTVVILAILLPTLILLRNRKGVAIELMLFVLVESFLVAIGWLSFWLLIATVVIMAFGIANIGSNAVLGR